MRTLLAFLAGIGISVLVSFTSAPSSGKKNASEVDQIQGLYIFVKSKPVSEFEFLGTVKGPAVGSHEFDKLLDAMIRIAKRDFPSANALVFDGAIRQTHNTRVSAVVIKE